MASPRSGPAACIHRPTEATSSPQPKPRSAGLDHATTGWRRPAIQAPHKAATPSKVVVQASALSIRALAGLATHPILPADW